MRGKAKRLISASPEEQKALFERLGKNGIKVNSIGDVLSLEKKKILTVYFILVQDIMMQAQEDSFLQTHYLENKLLLKLKINILMQ